MFGSVERERAMKAASRMDSYEATEPEYEGKVSKWPGNGDNMNEYGIRGVQTTKQGSHLTVGKKKDIEGFSSFQKKKKIRKYTQTICYFLLCTILRP